MENGWLHFRFPPESRSVFLITVFVSVLQNPSSDICAINWIIIGRSPFLWQSETLGRRLLRLVSGTLPNSLPHLARRQRTFPTSSTQTYNLDGEYKNTVQEVFITAALTYSRSNRNTLFEQSVSENAIVYTRRATTEP